MQRQNLFLKNQLFKIKALPVDLTEEKMKKKKKTELRRFLKVMQVTVKV